MLPGNGAFATMDWDNLVFNCCGFIAGLFLLHYGADLFVDHTAIIARRLKIPETLIILLTVGAEWEEVLTPSRCAPNDPN